MMAYTSWSVVFGEQPSAAKWNILGTNDASFNDGTGIANIEIGSGHTSLKNDYKFSVYRNAALNSGNNIATAVAYDTKLFDTSSNVDIVTNKGRFTAPVAGYYFFNSRNSVSGAPTFITSSINVNGSSVRTGWQENGVTSMTIISTTAAGLVQLSLSDYVEIYLWVSSSIALGVGLGTSYFDGHLVSQT